MIHHNSIAKNGVKQSHFWIKFLTSYGEMIIIIMIDSISVVKHLDILKWGFPKIGLPPVIIHKPSIYRWDVFLL